MMTLSDILNSDLLAKSEYDFLIDDRNLGKHIVLLGFGGSHAYGTNNENSDLDIRGIATNSKSAILLGNDFEQVVDVPTDTTIYSLDKIFRLLCSANPNTLEILGLKPEHYLYMTPIGEKILKNKNIFLSKRAIHTFAGYAHTQLRRMEHKAARVADQSATECDILKSIDIAMTDFRRRYTDMSEDAVKFTIDKAVQEGVDTEIFADISLKHYPLRDFNDLISETLSIVRAYSKIGKRNEKAVSHDKLGKHQMHLLRLYYMCFDILEFGEIVTYREKEHDFLMAVRNGEYLDENRQPKLEFYRIVDSLEDRLNELKERTDLPDNPDMSKVNALRCEINESIVKG